MSIVLSKVSCSSCGGSLNIIEGNKFCYCAYCGSCFYIQYSNEQKSISQMRPIQKDEKLSRDFEIAKNNALSNFLPKAILDYSLIDKGFCSQTPNHSRIYFAVRNGKLFIIEQISQFHVFEGKIMKKNDSYFLQTNYICSLNLDGRRTKRSTDSMSIEKEFIISMNNYGRLSLKGQKENFEIRLSAHYIPEYCEGMKYIERGINKL